MKRGGEAMAIGRAFKESLQKSLRSLEIGRSSVRSEIFVATRASPFPSPVGAAYSAPDGA
jgi:carbamoylphosphate synthase large subunit